MRRLLPAPMGSRPEPALMARAMAALYACIGILVFISMLVSYPTDGDGVGTGIVAVGSIAIGAALFFADRRVPLWLVHAAIFGAALEICVFIYFSGVSVG